MRKFWQFCPSHHRQIFDYSNFNFCTLLRFLWQPIGDNLVMCMIPVQFNWINN